MKQNKNTNPSDHRADDEIYNSETNAFRTFLACIDSRDKASKAILHYLYRSREGQLSVSCEQLALLDVGCGSCELEHQILPALQSRYNHIDITLLDPSDTVEAEARRLAGSWTGITVQHLRERIEDIDVSCLGSTWSFDLIICSHVLYYVPNWQQHILQYLSWLNDNGTLFLVLRSRDSEALQIQQQFLDIGRQRAIKPLYAEEVSHYLNDNSIEYKVLPLLSSLRFPALDAILMLEAIQRNNSETNKALQIGRFFTHRELWNSCSVSALEKLSNFYLQHQVGDEVILNIQELCFFCQKSSLKSSSQ